MLISALSKTLFREAEDKKQARSSHAVTEEHWERLTLSCGFIASDFLSPFLLT